MRDAIVDEVRKAREDYARQFDFDFDAICRDLRQKQESAGVPVVSLPARRLKRVPRKARQTRRRPTK